MTPLELADEIEDGPGAFRTESFATMKLIAAALRLAEADHAFQTGASRQARRARLGDLVTARDAYRAARSQT